MGCLACLERSAIRVLSNFTSFGYNGFQAAVSSCNFSWHAHGFPSFACIVWWSSLEAILGRDIHSMLSFYSLPPSSLIMQCISNCLQTISLYLLTVDGCWEVISRLFTGRLKSQRREQVDISNHRLLWSPGLSASVSMLKLTISSSRDLYAPSIGELPAWCV